MGQIKITMTSVINASADRVWKVLAQDFVDISNWGGGIISSRPNPDATKKFEEAPTGGRICEIAGMGEVLENIAHFDSAKHEIIWTATAEKLPGFVSDMQNAFTLKKIDGNTTEVTSNTSVTLNGIMGFLMKPMMKKPFVKQMNVTHADLGTFVETGKVSERKQRQIDKQQLA